MMTASRPGVLVTPGARHLGVIQMQPQRTMPAACVICGEPTKRPAYPSRVKNGRAQTCSRHCAGALSERRAADRETARFWSKVNKDGPTIRPELGSCWIWTGKTDEHGYGSFFCGSIRNGSRRFERAHRYAYEQEGTPIPDGLFGLHHCDNPPCVRPSHISPGTNQDNMDDMRAKGRGASGDRSGSRLHPERLRRGVAHYKARLTDDLVRALRAAVVSGESKASVGRRFNLTREAVRDIASGKRWRHVS